MGAINAISGFSLFNDTDIMVGLKVEGTSVIREDNVNCKTMKLYPMTDSQLSEQAAVKITVSANNCKSGAVILMYEKAAGGEKDVILKVRKENQDLKLEILDIGYCMTNTVKFTNLGAVSGNFYIRKDGESGKKKCLWYGSNRSVGYGDTVKLSDKSSKLTPYQNLYIGCNVDGSDPKEYQICYHPDGGQCSADLKGTAFKTWLNITDEGKDFRNIRMIVQGSLTGKIETSDSDYPNTIVLSTMTASVNKYYNYDTDIVLEDEVCSEVRRILLSRETKKYAISNLMPGKYKLHLETGAEGIKVITPPITVEVERPKNQAANQKDGKYITALTRIKANALNRIGSTSLADLNIKVDERNILYEYPVMYGIGLTVDYLNIYKFTTSDYLSKVDIVMKPDAFERLACSRYAKRCAQYLTQSTASELTKVCMLFEFLTLTARLKYASGNDGDNAYGCLWKRSCVCDGFARGFELLAQYAGLRCVKGGTGVISHAWNVIEIGHEWYHLDVTWAVNQQNAKVHLEHYLKSDEVYNKTHSKPGYERPWSCSGYAFPMCKDKRYDNSDNIHYDAETNKFPQGVMTFVYVEKEQAEAGEPIRITVGSIINKSDNADAYDTVYIIQIIKDNKIVKTVEAKMFQTESITLYETGNYEIRAGKKNVSMESQDADRCCLTIHEKKETVNLQSEENQILVEHYKFIDVNQHI